MSNPFEPPPIALTSLSIRDFRGIDELKMEFLGPDGRPNRLAVISGPNGCGKTAVLEAALIAVGGDGLAVGRIGRSAVRRGADDYEIRVELNRQRPGYLNEPPLEIIAGSNGQATGRPNQPIPHWYFSSWRAPTLVGPVDITVGKSGRRPAKTDINRLRNVKQQLANAAAIENFSGVTKRRISPKYTQWIERINEGWRKFTPDFESRFVVDLTEGDDPGPGAFEVFYQRDDRARLPVDDLSAGQLELFLFLAALVLNDDREGLVFIDEPELHLDPQWHAPMVRTLMDLQPKAQFIVATHSPEIHESAMSYERHFLIPAEDPRARAWSAIGAGAR